jgi:hypothetical protein
MQIMADETKGRHKIAESTSKSFFPGAGKLSQLGHLEEVNVVTRFYLTVNGSLRANLWKPLYPEGSRDHQDYEQREQVTHVAT